MGYAGALKHLELTEQGRPKSLKAGLVSFALRSKVEAELDLLQEQGILEETQHSDWTTQLVLVRIKDGNLRPCSDYRRTVNEATKGRLTSYPQQRTS